MTEVNIKYIQPEFELVINERFSSGITGIFGPSGSGKTTLLKSIAGLIKPSEGNILVNDEVVFDKDKTDLAPGKRKIGYVFQEGRLFPHMSVEKNLRYGMKNSSGQSIGFDEVVDLLDLRNILDRKPNRISGGERQRTALGRALLSNPDLLLLDEPFSAVDVMLRDQIIPFILNIRETTSIPIMVVSHDLPDLLKLTSTLFLIKNGRSIGHGNYYELLKNQEVSDFLGSNPLINAIDMQIKDISEEKEIMQLVKEVKGREVIIKCKTALKGKETGNSIRIFLHADHIALSSGPLEQVSIQNQLKGVVTDLIHRESSVLCMIDAGVKLAVEITSDSQERMKIKPGSNVCCLFKSVAIDIIG
ncbi:MAG: molybdenum ABC transporter ATP-binding protein [Bacteroidia bacterium]|nr:molybdenum ABC transporter ATP-binding protein [Bacteroidia bacterium]NNF83080.1 molybdenum ABC transporter ATP-binding protein [Flavobacteriaceae bacterium]